MNALTVPPVGEEFRNLGEQVYRALVEAIVQWRIKPGQRLVLEDLASQLKVSRTPVRDALSRLATLGLVEPAGRRGFAVAVLSPADLANLFELRLMCEVFAVRKGLGNLTPETLAKIEASAEACIRLSGSADPMDWLAGSLHDRELHCALVDLALNPRLAEFYERLNTHIYGLRAGRLPTTPQQARALNEREHGAVIAALRGGSPDVVVEALTTHILNARDRAVESLNWQTCVPDA